MQERLHLEAGRLESDVYSSRNNGNTVKLWLMVSGWWRVALP